MPSLCATTIRRPDPRATEWRLLLGARVTWHLALASMLGFFALPGLVQELYITLERLPGRPSYVELTQRSPDDLPLLGWIWIGSACCLILACLLPGRWHAHALRRVRLPTRTHVVDADAACSYRMAPEHRLLLDRHTLDRVQGAYRARLGITLLLLWPALFMAGIRAAVPLRWFSTVMGCGTVFAAPQEYLPVFVASTAILLLCGPSWRRVLGPLAGGLAEGDLELDPDVRGRGRRRRVDRVRRP